jgi:hypothetical protein
MSDVEEIHSGQKLSSAKKEENYITEKENIKPQNKKITLNELKSIYLERSIKKMDDEENKKENEYNALKNFVIEEVKNSNKKVEKEIVEVKLVVEEILKYLKKEE